MQGQPQTAPGFDPAIAIPQDPFGELQTTRSQLIGHIDSGEGLPQESNLGHLHRELAGRNENEGAQFVRTGMRGEQSV